MDPVTITSIAAAAIAFIDFGFKIFRRGLHAYETSLTDNARISGLTQASESLSDTSLRITRKLEGVMSRSEAQEHLLSVCRACSPLAEEISTYLAKLQISKAKVVKQKVLGSSSASTHDKKVTSFELRQARMREEIIFLTLFCLWESTMLDRTSSQTVGGHLNDIKTGVCGADEDTRRFARDLSFLTSAKTPAAMDTRERFIDNIYQVDWQPVAESIHGTLSVGYQETAAILGRRILDSLIFEGCVLRETMIATNHAKTFEWVFQDHGEDWDSLPRWLEDDTSVPYWINGKPGSGKSTLMKYLLSQATLKNHLHEWAGEEPLLFGAFYLWNAHMGHGKTFKGLLRILLSQILSLMPELVSITTVRRWAMLQILDPDTPTPKWRLPDLWEAFHLLGKENGTRFKLIIFIDGLDELDGNHEEIIRFIDVMRTRYRVKFCVTSRPWPIFSDYFRHSPSLRMQDCTKGDIARFVEDKFSSSDALQDLGKIFPQEMSAIQTEMVQKAQGVFLWVSIVTNLILQLVVNDPRLPALQDIMLSLPPDVSDLYDAIWRRVDLQKTVKASRYIQMVEAHSGCVDAQLLWLADGDNFAEKTPPTSLGHPTSLNALIPIMKRMLASHTGGILEISTTGDVTFLHRTAKDWIHQPDAWKQVCAATPEDFDPYFSLAQGLMIHVKQSQPMAESQFQLSVVKILCWVSQIRSDYPCVPQLVSFLDSLDQLGQEFGTNRDQELPDPQNHKHQGPKAPELFSVNNWTKELYKNQSCEYSFMGLIALFAIAPYIKAKVSKSSRIWMQRKHPALRSPLDPSSKGYYIVSMYPQKPEQPHRLSLLESAVFGWALRQHEPSGFLVIIPESFKVPLDTPQRLQTVQTLLKAGASMRQKGVTGLSIYSEVRHKLRHMRHRSAITRALRALLWVSMCDSERDESPVLGPPPTDYEIQMRRMMESNTGIAETILRHLKYW